MSLRPSVSNDAQYASTIFKKIQKRNNTLFKKALPQQESCAGGLFCGLCAWFHRHRQPLMVNSFY